MDHQETHPLFDLWAGLWVLSNVVGPTVSIAGPAGPIRPNIYVLFVAESGLARKSTAVNRAVELLRRTRTAGTWITRGISPDRLLKEAKSDHLIFAASELVSLLGKSSIAYQLPGLLTDLYDGHGHRGLDTPDPGRALRAIYPTFLGAAAPSWLLGSINTDVLQGGFSSRLMVVHANRGKGLRPWPTDVVDDTDALRELDHVVRHLDRAVAVPPDGRAGGDHAWVVPTGEHTLRLDRDALDTYQQLYIQQSREDHRGTFRPSFYSRWSTHVLKTAGLLAINNGSCSIKSMDLERAETLTRTAGDHGDQVFNRTKGDQLLKSIEAVKRVLVQQGTNLTTHTELARRTRLTGLGQLRVILDTLQDLDMIQAVEVQGPRGRPTLMYRATTRMLEVSSEQVSRLMDRN